MTSLCNTKDIALLVNPSWLGEHSFAFRLQRACQNIQWTADILYFPHTEKLYTKQYDFVICLTPDRFQKPRCRCYLALFHPKHHYFNDQVFLKKEFASFDGYLLSYDPNSQDLKENNFNKNPQLPFLLWYPTCERRPFCTVNPIKLFHILATWGDRLENTKFRTLWNLLDESSLCLFYGSRQFASLNPKSYQGPLSFDDGSIYSLTQNAGVTLVIHSKDHNIFGIPSGRIFEAAACCSVIISDKNAFVRKHFGDSVLYINTESDGSAIFSQIENHMLWIQNNKGSALKMAKRSFQIYRNFFLLEHQLENFGKLHDLQTKK